MSEAAEDSTPQARVVLAVISESEEMIRTTLTLLTGVSRIEVKTFSRVLDFQEWVTGKPIAGILIDMKTLIRAKAEERFFINSLIQALPIAKIRMDAQSKALVGSVGAQTLRGDAFVQYLVSQVLQETTPRKIRQYFRTAAILNAKVYHPDLLGDQPFLTTTVDISEGGLFFLVNQKLAIRSKLQLEIVNFKILERIACEVRWCLPWGENVDHYPGVGVRFLELSESQRQQIFSLTDARASGRA